MIFSMLNFKDMLDIVDILNVKKIDNIQKIISFFSMFNCLQTDELFSFDDSLKENINIKSFFYRNLFRSGKTNIGWTSMNLI